MAASCRTFGVKLALRTVGMQVKRRPFRAGCVMGSSCDVRKADSCGANDHGAFLRALRPARIAEVAGIALEHVPVEKHQRAEGLVLVLAVTLPLAAKSVRKALISEVPMSLGCRRP